MKRRRERGIIDEGGGVRETGMGTTTVEELQERGEKGNPVCGGRRWSAAVVRCKSPSTAFNYDVIANTDDGYFLRYTLYITRGPTASYSRAHPNQRPRGGSLSVCVNGLTYLTTKPCDCFRMFQNAAHETRFSPTVLSDSFNPGLCLLANKIVNFFIRKIWRLSSGIEIRVDILLKILFPLIKSIDDS